MTGRLRRMARVYPVLIAFIVFLAASDEVSPRAVPPKPKRVVAAEAKVSAQKVSTTFSSPQRVRMDFFPKEKAHSDPPPHSANHFIEGDFRRVTAPVAFRDSFSRGTKTD